MDSINLVEIPSELIINHIINVDIFVPLMLTCSVLYATVNKYIIAGKVNDPKYKQIMFNKLLATIKAGNTRAMRHLLHMPMMSSWRRDWMSVSALFKQYCGLSHNKTEYRHALRLVVNPNVDVACYIYHVIRWCCKTSRRDLFDAIIARGPDREVIYKHFADLMTDLLTLEDEYYIGKLLDYILDPSDTTTQQRDKFRYVNGILWRCAHPNLQALTTALGKLKPYIKISEYVCSTECDSTASNILRLIWPYCTDRVVDIYEAVRKSIYYLDHAYLEFIHDKLSANEMTLCNRDKSHTINPMLIKVVRARGLTKVYTVLNELSKTLLARQITN